MTGVSLYSTLSYGSYVKNEVIVKYNARTSGYVQLQVPDGATVESEITRLKQQTAVESVQPNYIYKPFINLNDPAYRNNQWYLDNNAQTILGASTPEGNPGTAGLDINAEKAWDVASDCSNVIVAVIDTGVNYNAVDLQNNVWDGSSCVNEHGISIAGGCNHGYDYIDNDNDPMDFNGHGTLVAGVIGAEGNNSFGTVGVCHNVQIMAIRALGTNGGTSVTVSNAIKFAVNNGAHVINMSLGAYTSDDDYMYRDAMKEAEDAGIFMVSAAGNDTVDVDETTVFPCAYSGPTHICVGALDQKYDIAEFSNYGKNTVDIFLPGTNFYGPSNGETAHLYIESEYDSGWTFSGDWVNNTIGTCYIGAPEMISFPSTFCENFPKVPYAHNSTGIAQVAFGEMLKNFDYGHLEFRVRADVGETDYVGYLSGSDPIDFTNPSTPIYPATDDYYKSDLFSCVGSSTCNFGIAASLGTYNLYGIFLSDLSVYGGTLYNESFTMMSGTSFSAPLAAGMAAILLSYNEDYTASDIKYNFQNAGLSDDKLAISGVDEKLEAIEEKSISGQTVDLFKSLEFVSPPTNLNVIIID